MEADEAGAELAEDDPNELDLEDEAGAAGALELGAELSFEGAELSEDFWGESVAAEMTFLKFTRCIGLIEQIFYIFQGRCK